MTNKIVIYIEIEKNSNIVYKYCEKNKSLLIDKVLDPPFFYPYSYGFIFNEQINYENKINTFIITDKEIKNNQYYETYIIGMIVTEDEKGMSEIILCVLEEDYLKIKDIYDLNNEIKDKIYYFLENYKKNNIFEYLKVIGYLNKNIALRVIKKLELEK
jgi:inorganic pyrophosphatase